MAGLSLKGVKKSFGPQTALRGVSLDFDAALMHGVIGPEGAGKALHQLTDLLMVLVGLDELRHRVEKPP